MAARRVPVLDRFWPKVGPPNGRGCRLWTAGASGDGYGAFKVEGRQVGAHRQAWILTFGPVPDDIKVLHHCDTPLCCEPPHLFLGTHADNMRDMTLKLRGPNGEHNPKAKLTEDDVRAIRLRWSEGEGQTALAAEYGVKVVAVWRLINGWTWKHVA